MTSWREEQSRVARIARIDVPALHERWEAGPDAAGPRRARARRVGAGHIPGSMHVPYHDIDAVPDGVDVASRSR